MESMHSESITTELHGAKTHFVIIPLGQGIKWLLSKLNLCS